MAGPVYFAWVGGDPIPALSLETTGDIWSGTWVTNAAVWGGSLSTSADILAGGLTLANLVDTTGLATGGVYTIKGSGIPSILTGALADTTFTFDGGAGGTLSQACTVAEGVSISLTSPAGTDTIILDDVRPLVLGETYSISGSGIQPDATFVFEGGNAVTLSPPADATGLVSVTVSSEAGIDVISNLADVTDLIVGLTYDLFALGLPAGAQGTYTGGAALALLARPTQTGLGVPLFISKGKTYPDGGPFDEFTHLREDEEIFAIELTQREGDFAELTLEVRNPRIGLLAAGRNLWGWLSWRNSADEIVPLFHGRLIGVPDNLQDEVVPLKFLARPNDFFAQKAAVASGLRVLPYWDPVWLIDNVEDPDTVLEARTANWHIDPITLTVTVSDIVTGEDGTIDVTEGGHLYEAMTVAFGAPPLRRVNVSGTVTWTQVGSGDVDLTTPLVEAFAQAGSPYHGTKIASYTADGLLNAWPAPKAAIGGGWSVGEGTAAELTLFSENLVVTYMDRTDLAHVFTTGLAPDPAVNPGAINVNTVTDMAWKPFFVVFQMTAMKVSFTAHFEAARRRSEVVEFVVDADVQSIVTDPLTAEEDTISLNSAFVDQPVDPGGDTPLGDLRRNSYFTIGRGQSSLQFLMLLARAKLVARARAVDIGIVGKWDKFAGVVSLRKSLTLHDDRLPGGIATGKIKAYRLTMSGSGGGMQVEVTIGCTVGYGTAVTAADGTDAYADGYAVGYTQAPGSGVSVIEEELVYQSLDGGYVLDDDGVDFTNMTPGRVLRGITITGGPTAQENAINGALHAPGMVAAETDAETHGGTFLIDLKATESAQEGAYVVLISQALDTDPGPFTVSGPGGSIIGRGLRGAPFKAAGLSFSFPLGFLVSDSQIHISVSKEAAGSAGVVPDPIGALGALPTRIEVDLVPVTGGDFESTFVVRVMPLVIPQTINLEAA